MQQILRRPFAGQVPPPFHLLRPPPQPSLASVQYKYGRRRRGLYSASPSHSCKRDHPPDAPPPLRPLLLQPPVLMWVTAGRRTVLTWCPAPTLARGSVGAAAASFTATAVRPAAAFCASRGRRPLRLGGEGIHRQGVTTMAASGLPKIDAYALGTPNGTLAGRSGGRVGGWGEGDRIPCDPPAERLMSARTRSRVWVWELGLPGKIWPGYSVAGGWFLAVPAPRRPWAPRACKHLTRRLLF